MGGLCQACEQAFLRSAGGAVSDLLIVSLGFSQACSFSLGVILYWSEFAEGYVLQRTNNLIDYALK